MYLIESATSNGVYSLYKGGLKQPVRSNIPDDIDISDMYSEGERRSRSCDTIDSIDEFLDDLYKLRQESLLTGGEYSKGNLVFKELRNNNILGELRSKKIELENEAMSIKESLMSAKMLTKGI